MNVLHTTLVSLRANTFRSQKNHLLLTLLERLVTSFSNSHGSHSHYMAQRRGYLIVEI
jgi:hypothetical protein